MTTALQFPVEVCHSAVAHPVQSNWPCGSQGLGLSSAPPKVFGSMQGVTRARLFRLSRCVHLVSALNRCRTRTCQLGFQCCGLAGEGRSWCRQWSCPRHPRSQP
ncbi:hypothetical protein lerEdw1_007576 [Lerista edwardsae]|nr:hypothetical protein lerEdw1_007576 [Lerista edwardsae]